MKRILCGMALLALCVTTANAALISRLSGAAYYDDVLDITWLADANLAKTSGYDADGVMTWSQAQGWIGSLNAANYLGANDWRLPTVVDTGTPGCAAIAYSGTDCGFNVQTISGAAVYSEMAHLYYSTLGNVGYYDTSGVLTGCSAVPITVCLSNEGPFLNLEPVVYWSTGYAPDAGQAWRFGFHSGYQYPELKGTGLYAWAVRRGDIAQAPYANCPDGLVTPDSDGDGVPDLCDNCIEVSNVVQTDADRDGYGNRCDGDFNNSGGSVNTVDYSILRSVINKPSSFSANAARSDLNGDGTVNTIDYSIFRTLINKVPGPSGRRGTPTAFQSTPAAGSTKSMPVVVINYMPTSDGVNVDTEATGPGTPATISGLQDWITTLTTRTKFMLEEGSRFRGYQNPAASPYLGYKVVAVWNFYETPPVGRPVSAGRFFPNYQEILGRIPAEQYVEQDGVREFWLYGYDTASVGLKESNMASPSTGDISNSDRDPTDLPIFDKTYIVYQTNYSRSQAEAVHNHGHQLEAMFSHVANRQDASTALFWLDFTGFNPATGSVTLGRCGWTHMPPNTNVEYDFTNYSLVASDCEDWRPDGSGAKKLVNADTWGLLPYSWPDGAPASQLTESQWYIYWMQNMPGAGNVIPYDNVTMENWWDIVADWDAAITMGKGLHK